MPIRPGSKIVPKQSNRQADQFRRAFVETQKELRDRPDAATRIAVDFEGSGTEDIVFSGAVTKVIYHHLGHDVNGWRVIDQTANANVWRVSSDDKTITLQSSAAVTIRLEVF